MPNIKDTNVDKLLEGILTLQTLDEALEFFKDLCTVREMQSMAQRYVVARMLTDKRVYKDIVSETGASTATISRVNRSLSDSSNGYALVFSRVDGKKS